MLLILLLLLSSWAALFFLSFFFVFFDLQHVTWTTGRPKKSLRSLRGLSVNQQALEKLCTSGG